jgi:ZIP family zinc transporter
MEYVEAMSGGFLTALLYGLGASCSLVLGGVIGARAALPRPVLAGALAFGSGALIAAFAFELVQRPFEVAGAVVASLADTVMPEAYREGGLWIAFATVAGFFLSFLLSTI